MIQIDLPNIPVPWSAPRLGRKGAYNPKNAEKNFTRWQVRSLYKGDPIPGYVAIQFTFFMPVPASTSLKKKKLMLQGEIIPTHCDCTNLQKFYEDCLKQIVITDDRNVAQISSKKLYGDREKIVIKIWTLEEYKKGSQNEGDY